MNNYEKNERITKILSIFSLVSLVIAIASFVLYAFFGGDTLDTIAVAGLTAFVLPILVLQVAMPANFHIFGTKDIGVPWSLFFFLFIFPFADLWFFSGINTLFNIIPDYGSVIYGPMNEQMKEFFRNEAMKEVMKEAGMYIGSIYVGLISTGLLLRKRSTKKNVLQ